MKWLSVKKYTAPKNQRLLFNLRDSATQDSFVIVGRFDNERKRWERDDKTPLEQTRYKVTHFCIPDPIEIEEDE